MFFFLSTGSGLKEPFVSSNANEDASVEGILVLIGRACSGQHRNREISGDGELEVNWGGVN